MVNEQGLGSSLQMPRNIWPSSFSEREGGEGGRGHRFQNYVDVSGWYGAAFSSSKRKSTLGPIHVAGNTEGAYTCLVY